MADADWKKRLGFDINYSSSQSSDEDDTIDSSGIAVDKRWHLDTIVAEYDHLSSTPPRTRIRNKEKHKSYNISEVSQPQGMDIPGKQVPRRNTTDNFLKYDNIHIQEGCVENKRSKRRSLKLLRGSERDLKLDIGKCKNCRTDCPPFHSTRIQSIPTLVESCNRFMSLSSKPVQAGKEQQPPVAPSLYKKTTTSDTSLPISTSTQPVIKDSSNSSREDSADSRAIFHSTFSMLIRMGNMEKNTSCKRTMSVEEHTWQNELKDLIWLEVSARIAGRTPTQQDAFLCSKREEVQGLLQEILDFKFEPLETCSGDNSWYQFDTVNSIPEEKLPSICLNINCRICCQNVGKAMQQVIGLLDALAEAEALYPSTKAMASHHSVILQKEFIDKTKAMCLWYNMVRYQRLSLIIIRKLLTNHRWRTKTDTSNNTTNSVTSSDICSMKCQKVKFSIEPLTTTDTSSSGEADSQCGAAESYTTEQGTSQPSDDEGDGKSNSNVHIEITRIQSTDPLSLTEHDGAEGFLKVRSISQEVPKSPYESADSSSGSVNSTESGFVSSFYDTHEDQNYHRPEKNLFDIGDLSNLTKLRLFYPNNPSPYRDYLEKILKSRGIRSALYFLEKMYLHLLKKTRMTLEKFEDAMLSQSQQTEEYPDNNPDLNGDCEDSDDDFELEQHESCHVDIVELKKEHLDLRRYGARCKETLDMQLPSYKSTFLYLSTLPMESIHEFLTMKLETKPEKPSILSIKQLICELRDGLTIAVRVRTRFVRHIQTALHEEPDNSVCRIVFNRVLDTFEKTLDNVYKLYLSYLSDWAGVEYLPRAALAAEWAFNCWLARSLRPAATLSPLTFCCLTVRQLNGGADRLKTRVTELEKEVARIKQMKQADPNDLDGNIKWKILTKCRVMQCMLTEERERIISTSQFARSISMHLHYNSVFRRFRQKIYEAMNNVRDVICWLITNTEDATSPKRLAQLEEPDKPSVQSRTREIVSQAYKFGFEFHKEMCRLINDTLSPECLYNPCARNSLSQNRRSKLIRSESVNENNHTSIEETIFYLNTPTVTNQEFQFPSNGNARPTGKKLKEDSFSRCLYRSGYKKFQKNFIQGTKFPSFDSIASGISLADLNHDDYKNGIPGCEDCNKSKSKEDEGRDEVDFVTERRSSEVDLNIDWEENVSRSLVTFSKQWMNFAMQRCERGRGLRPRWASHGLEFLMLTCDPQHTKHLTDVEFEELKEMMDSCISHVIGTAGGSGCASAVGTPTLSMPTPQRTRSSIHYPQHSYKATASSPPAIQDFPMPVLTDAARVGKRMSALCELDHRRDACLRKAGVIGCVRQGAESRDHFRPRPVTFKWQRGIKIGQGRFGKVYTVVNTETGSLLAMKEVSLALGDRRAVERAANELKILEGVVHPNLVQYYGVEIHREEMLIFMELCVEGSLEALIADTCVEEGVSGLPEGLVRKYTRQLVSAIRALHVRSIAHRDIKSGNIFLTEGGNCLKLGDFGCAVKIRANTTVPGELQGYVGTQAYMAPEVFMKSSGHGRAADIWSLGCVVVEMSSGKRPWSEYDSNYQIMFVVGMGGRPQPPATLSPEGVDFCCNCLQHDPKQRATIDELSNHNFIKTNLHEEF